MFRLTFTGKFFAVSGLLVGMAPAMADVTAYTDYQSYANALSGLESQSGFGGGLDGASEFTGSTDFGTYSYSASVDGGFFMIAGPDSTQTDVYSLSTKDANPINFSSFGSTAAGFGGTFYATDTFEQVIPAQMFWTVYYKDGLSISNSFASTSSYFGLTWTTPISSISIGVADPDANAYVTANSVSFGSVSAVPEPSAFALWLAGAAVITALAKRRARPIEVIRS